MSNDRPTGSDVFDDFNPARLIGQANATAKQRDRPRRGRYRKNQWDRQGFNSKVPRWVRSAARAFADDEDDKLQDLHAVALVAYMKSHGFDVDYYRPPAEVEVPDEMVELKYRLDQL